MDQDAKKKARFQRAKLQAVSHLVGRYRPASDTEGPTIPGHTGSQDDPAKRPARQIGKEKRYTSTNTSLFSDSTATTNTSMASATKRAVMSFQDSLMNIRRKATAATRSSESRQESSSTAATLTTDASLTHMVPDRLKIFVGTWNMYGRLLPINLATFLTPNQPDWHDTMLPHLDGSATHPYHILAIGTQECERDISESLFYSSKEVWETRLSEYLGANYKLLRTETLAALHLAVFVWLPVSHYVKGVHSEHIKTGWANMIGNKGAVAISVLFGTRSLLFINCHLTAHQSKLAERNANVHRILHELKIPDFNGENHHHNGFRLTHRSSQHNREPVTKEEENLPHAHSEETNVLRRFDHVFLFGDTNYRINAERTWVLESIRKGDYKSLLKFDQLSLARSAPDCPLACFKESPIAFPPTYKFDTTATTEPNTPSSSTSTMFSAYRNTPPTPSPVTPPSSATAVSSKSSFRKRLPSVPQVRRATAPAALNTLCYDTSPKQRVPSWTDRILWHDRPSLASENEPAKADTPFKKMKRRPKVSAKEKKKMQEEYEAIRQRKGFPTASSAPAALQIPLQQQLLLQQWWKRKRATPKPSRDTVCWFYNAAMDEALFGVSDHMPVVAVFGVWFDEWQTKRSTPATPVSEKEAGVSKEIPWWQRFSIMWKAKNTLKNVVKAKAVPAV